MKTVSSASNLLACRTFCYELLQTVYGAKPAPERMALACHPDAQAAFASVLDQDDAPTALQAFADAAASDAQTAPDAYRRLFEAPGQSPVSLWESVYVNPEPLLMQPSTLDVRNSYRAQGFLPAQYPHVADDHIAIELDFMANLARLAHVACEEGDADGAVGRLEASQRFLREHLLRWVDDFADTMERRGKSAYYQAATALLALFLRADDRLIAELAAELQD